MANEISIRIGLGVRKGNIDYQSRPNAYRATMDGTGGPFIGTVNVPTNAGVDIDLTAMTTPGVCHIRNTDATNYVEYGLYVPALSAFFPLGEVLPGESYILRFSRNLTEDYSAPGTGTDSAVARLHLRAHTAACKVVLEVFDA